MASSSSLCPGYKHVENFGADDEYEDEEVMYVTLDLGSIEPTLVPSSSTYRLIGLDTPTPFLQLSGTILKGRHDTLLGTELLFTDGKDPHDRNKRSVNHVASTEQRICFKEVRLVPKGTEAAADGRAGGKKGKGKETGEDLIDPTIQLEEASQMVDRVTGKNAPRTRAPRTTRSSFGDGPRQTRSSKAKGKGKAKAVDSEPPDEESGGEERDDMDIYEG